MSSFPAERSETEPSLGATESPGPVILAHESLAPGIRPARRLKDAVIAERRHDRVEVVAVEGISDPRAEQANLGDRPPLPLDQSGKSKQRSGGRQAWRRRV